MKARVLLATALTLGSTGVSIALGTPVAQADQACNWSPTTGVRGPTDSDINGPYSVYNLYNGDSTSCGKTGATAVQGLWIKVICLETNNAGTRWAYIQISPGVKGWVSRANIGTIYPLPGDC